MITKIFKCYFTTPLHIGTSRADYTESKPYVHSDTLYAAIIQMLALLGESTYLDKLTSLGGQPTFTLSSMFPFYRDEKKKRDTVYFLPRPFRPFYVDIALLPIYQDYAKDIKDLQWLSLELFKEHLSNSKGLKIEDASWLQEQYLSTTAIEKDFIKPALEPKVTIGRDKQESSIYYLERLYFNKNCGLYFIFRGEEADFQMLEKAIYLLQQEGIGNDRNVGNGKFTAMLADPNVTTKFDNLFNNFNKATHGCNLSLYNPEKRDVEHLASAVNQEKTSYELVQRGGWITTFPYEKYRKKNVYMFKEGSILPLQNWKESLGKTRIITPEIMQSLSDKPHDIFRTGKSLFVPVNMG